MKSRSAIKIDPLAREHHRRLLADIESFIDFAALVAEVDEVAPCPVSAQGGPSYPTGTMVRILVLNRAIAPTSHKPMQ